MVGFYTTRVCAEAGQRWLACWEGVSWVVEMRCEAGRDNWHDQRHESERAWTALEGGGGGHEGGGHDDDDGGGDGGGGGHGGRGGGSSGGQVVVDEPQMEGRVTARSHSSGLSRKLGLAGRGRRQGCGGGRGGDQDFCRS